MKKGLYVILAVLTVLAMVMVSCGGDETDETNTYTVTYDGNGNTDGTAPAKVDVKVGEKTTIPGAGSLVKTDAIFKGWNTKRDGSGIRYPEGDLYTPNGSITLYAEWMSVLPIPDGKVRVIFDYDGGTPDTPTYVDVTKDAAIGALPTPTKSGFTLDGWYSGTTKYDVTTTVSANITLKAKWTAGEGPGPGPGDLYDLPAGAIELGDFTWENNATQKGWKTKGTDNSDTDLVAADVTAAQYLVLDLSKAPTGGLQFTWQGNGDSWGWNQVTILNNDGTVDEDLGAVEITDIEGVVQLKINFSKAAVKYAKFRVSTQVKFLIAYYSSNVADLGIQRAYIEKGQDGDKFDLAGAEKVILNNSWYAVYKFELPAGKTWGDYKGLSAGYLLGANDFASAVARGARLLGPYTLNDFSFYNGTGDADKMNLAVANYNAGKNNQFILDNTYGWGKWGNGENDGTLIKNLADKGITAEAGKWFTLEYKIDGSGKFTGNPAYDDANLPAEDAKGPFYFGIGIAGQNNGGNAQYIRDVKLIGHEDEDTITATPAYFSKDGVRYPAFAGYNTPDGSNGYAEASRAMADGGNPAAVDVVVVEGAEKVVLNNSWYVVYKFELPAGKTWDDYKSLSADYMLGSDDFANAVARGARLLGAYKETDFTFYAGTGNALGKDLYVANYNAGKNNQFILDNTYGWGKWGNGENDGTLIKNLADKGITAKPAEWFTLEYKIDGSGKFTGSPAYDDANLPAASDTGPFYFGVGIAGQNNGGNVQLIKNVKLIGYDDTILDVIGTPAYLKEGTADVPVFAGYNTPDGSNGYAEASRKTGTFVVLK